MSHLLAYYDYLDDMTSKYLRAQASKRSYNHYGIVDMVHVQRICKRCEGIIPSGGNGDESDDDNEAYCHLCFAPCDDCGGMFLLRKIIEGAYLEEVSEGKFVPMNQCIYCNRIAREKIKDGCEDPPDVKEYE